MTHTLNDIEKEIQRTIDLNTNITEKIRIKKGMLALLKQEIEDLYLEQDRNNDKLIKLYDKKNKQSGPS
ncbi:unnamed protein product [Rotaria sordida]|uniref:Uncharacterized protein n=2 Tax=Rotaria sordida TaxID=392033 RepID=A0A814XEM4_9BILA|nr:unnamed protein product [Rotaria sordida]